MPSEPTPKFRQSEPRWWWVAALAECKPPSIWLAAVSRFTLLDKKPAIGGVMAQLDKTFPTNDCAMCTMAPRLVEIGRHKDIEILTLSEVERD